MRVLVCGGRDFDNIAFIWTQMNRIHTETPITAMITGGQRGVDTIANEWGKTKPIERFVSRAEWKKYGRPAGPKRNARMLEWRPDLVVAFPGGPGTANMIEQAKRACVPVKKIK